MRRDRNGRRIPLSLEERAEVQALITRATKVALPMAPGGLVLWFGKEGADRAASFQERKRKAGVEIHKTLPQLLSESDDGRALLTELEKNVSWHVAEEVWWILSERAAASAIGDVNVFGKTRDLRADLPPTEQAVEFKAEFAGDPTYYSRVFDKIERPALEDNDRVERVFFNESLAYSDGKWVDDAE